MGSDEVVKTGNIITKHRMEKNLPLYEFATLIAKSSRTVKSWEDNEREPSLLDLINICKVLNFPLTEFGSEYTSILSVFTENELVKEYDSRGFTLTNVRDYDGMFYEIPLKKAWNGITRHRAVYIVLNDIPTLIEDFLKTQKFLIKRCKPGRKISKKETRVEILKGIKKRANISKTVDIGKLMALYYAGWTFDEIADEMKMSRSNVALKIRQNKDDYVFDYERDDVN